MRKISCRPGTLPSRPTFLAQYSSGTSSIARRQTFSPSWEPPDSSTGSDDGGELPRRPQKPDVEIRNESPAQPSLKRKQSFRKTGPITPRQWRPPNSEVASTYQDDSQLDFAQWKKLLDHEVKQNGLDGAKSVWQRLIFGTKMVELDSEDEYATATWMKLLSVAAEARDLTFINLLCQSVKGVARRRTELFTEVISTLLRHECHQSAHLWVKKLKERIQNRRSKMCALFELYNPHGRIELTRFFEVYDIVRPGRMYGFIMRQLLDAGRADDAYIAHRLLIVRNDVPSSFAEAEPYVVHLAKTSQKLSPFLAQLEAAGVKFTSRGRAKYALQTQAMQNAAKQDAHSGGAEEVSALYSKPNAVSDRVAAKAFATRALSFDFALNALKAFGLTEIGPQSIREMGLASPSMDEFARRLETLDDDGVDTGSSTYSRIVRRLCSDKEFHLLEKILNTDMHHDVFEDTEALQHLLVESLCKANWSQANLLLTILNHGIVGPLQTSVANALGSLDLFAGDRQRFALGLLSSKDAFDAVAHRSLRFNLMREMLEDMRTWKSRGWSKLERRNGALRVASFMQDSIMAGVLPNTFHWRHVLSRLGSTGGIQEVVSLIYWIARGCTLKNLSYRTVVRHGTPSRVLSSLFDVRFQRAFLHWTLKECFASFTPDHTKWSRSLRLLHHLNQQYGVPVYWRPLRKIIVMRCRYLYQIRARLYRARELERGRPIRYADPRLICLRIINYVHDLWSTTPNVRAEELDLARRSLRTPKLVRHAPSRYAALLKEQRRPRKYWTSSGWQRVSRPTTASALRSPAAIDEPQRTTRGHTRTGAVEDAASLPGSVIIA